MTNNYETIESGIRVRHGSEGDSYNVSLELAPRKGRKEKSYTFHVGSFPTLEKAREVRTKAEDIYNKTEGKKQAAALMELKEQYKRRNKMCCGKKVMRSWKYCPYCGKDLYE